MLCILTIYPIYLNPESDLRANTFFNSSLNKYFIYRNDIYHIDFC